MILNTHQALACADVFASASCCTIVLDYVTVTRASCVAPIRVESVNNKREVYATVADFAEAYKLDNEDTDFRFDPVTCIFVSIVMLVLLVVLGRSWHYFA